MPLGPIVDSHVHLWDPDGILVPWLQTSSLNSPHGLTEYDQATEGVEVDAIVYLEIDAAESYRLTEAKQIARLAEHDPRIQGIVACAPLEDGDHVRGLLEDLVAIGPLVKGIRRIYQDEPDPAFCLRPGFVRGVQILPEYGLTCDLCGNATQLESTIELVRQCPGTEFILDHINKPDIRGGQFEPWAQPDDRNRRASPTSSARSVAPSPRPTGETGPSPTSAPTSNMPWTAFGEDRVVFGGDWPVVTNASPWRGWVDALDEITAGYSDAAKRKLWSENARRFYRLPRRASGLMAAPGEGIAHGR